MTEPDESDLETKILEVLSNHTSGVSHKIFLDSVPSLNAQQLVKNLNRLLSQHKIQLLQKGNQLVYKLKDLSSSQNYQGTDIEEKVIFEAVERAGNNGISGKELQTQCHLAQARINKILKSLEDKKLIKCIKITSRKKVFMLYDLEPSQTVTGGTFYSDQEFESDFVDALGNQCYKYLLQAKSLADKLSDPVSQRNASYKSSKDICDYINGLKISKIKLSQKDIEAILESLIYDDKLEKSVSLSKSHSTAEKLYRVTKPLIGNSGFMMVPCGVCEISQDCHVGGEISPATCEYMRQWLDF